MNNIGNIIKEYRSILGMSRKELSEGICSDKYLYLIEKGQRTPSSEITRLLGDKMGVDLCKYNEYFDCIDPIRVSFFIEQFNRFRRENDFYSLAKATEEALKIEDYHNGPWKYEIKLNGLIIKVLSEGDFIRSIPMITDIISEMEQKRLNHVCVVNFYVLLSVCYQMARDLDNARKIVMLTSKIIDKKQKIAKYVHSIVVAKISKISMHYLEGEFQFVIEDVFKLMEYENEMCYQKFSHYGLFYLSYAYYQSSLQAEGIQWFQKALSLMLISYRVTDMHYLSSYDIFRVMIQDKRVSKDLIQEFMEEYNTIKI